MKKDLYNKIFAPSDCLPQQLLVGYLKGTLNEQQTHKVEEHLVDCEFCSEALDGLMLVKDESVLGAVTNDVKNAVNKKESKKRIAPSVIWLAAAASFAIIIASVFAIKTITTGSNKQLAVNELKVPVTKDSLRSADPKSEEDEAMTSGAVETEAENEIIENEPAKNTEIRTFNSKAAPERKLNSEIASVEKADNEQVIISEEKNADDVAFTDKKTKDLTFPENQSIKANSPTEQSAGSLSEIKTITSNKMPAEKQEKLTEQIGYVHNLKVIDYSKEMEEKILEPPANNTEAKYATPEVKQEAATASVNKTVSYKEIISPALEAYQQKKYSLAIVLLNNISKENPLDMNARFYSGMANYYLKNYSSSLENLQPLIKMNNNTFFEESKYYMALNYIELNELLTAKNLLIEVINLDGFYKNRAEEKLKELK